jgi:uncharacterized membrane protein
MTHYVKLYLATLAAFAAVDLVWLGFVARSFYRKHLGYLMAPNANWLAVILFYLVFIAGLLYFVVVPGLKANSLSTTLLRAALFGLITYATYDLTNLATVKDWPVLVTVVDMVWGSCLCVVVSWISFLAGRWLG